MDAALALDYPNGLIGTTIEGRYKIEAVLAQGGMGTVFRATHLTLNRPVALKILRPDLESDQTQRFLREAHIVAQLEHRNCVAVFDHGRSGEGLHFMAMQLLKGHVLANDTGRPMDPIRAAMIVADILRGLEHAHARNVVHRDLKPENLFVTTDEDGQECIKLLDFGIAKFKQPMDSSDGAVTLSGLMAGTPAYMSPEQVIGADTDERTDIYSTGVILYELLAGHPPFNTDDPVVLLHHQLNEEFTPLPETVPARLQEIVQRMCDKEKAKRFPSTSEALVDIDAFLFDATDGAIAGASSSTRRWGGAPRTGRTFVKSGRNSATLSDVAALDEDVRLGRPWWHWGVAAGLLLVAGGVAIPMLMASSEESSADATQEPQAIAVAAPLDEAEGEAPLVPPALTDRSGFLRLLAKVNDPDHPLPYEARQQSLEALSSSDYGDKVDTRLQTALNLAQATESQTPCRTFREALSTIEKSKDSFYAAYVLGSEVPQRGAAETDADCNDLSEQLGAAQQAFGAEAPETESVEKVVQTTKMSRRRAARRRSSSRPRSEPKPSSNEPTSVDEVDPAPTAEPLPSVAPAPSRKTSRGITKLEDDIKEL